MKKSRRFVGVVAVVLMLTLMIGILPVQAEQQGTITVVSRYEGELNNRWTRIMTYDEAINQGELYLLAGDMAGRYENVEILNVNGVPWQDSAYADIIKKGLRYNYAVDENQKPLDYLALHPDIREEIVMNKNYNGWGKDVVFLEKQGKNVDQIKQIVSAAIEKKYPPGYIANKKITDVAQILGNNSGSNSNTNGTSGQIINNSTIEVKIIPGNRTYTVIKGNTRTGGTFAQAPFLKNGTLMIPVRGVFEQFGASIAWESGQAVIRLNGKTVKITPSKTTAAVNDKTVSISTPAMNVRGNIFIPLRFVSEQIGLNATWNASQKYASIKNK